MAALLPPSPVNPTGELAQYLPSYDPAPVIAAQEQSLQEFLNLPVKEILARLGLPAQENLPPEREGDRPHDGQPAEPPPPAASPMDPSALISPVTDALGTLGSGLFEGVDPTAMLQGISQAFQSTGGSLQQSLAAVDDAWKGESGTSAAAKTATAIADGAKVGAQSDALRESLTTATAEVTQARARLIAIIAEFQATLAAIGPSIIFPWGWAAAIAAANKAITSAAEVMTSLQASLGSESAKVTAAGMPVEVTSAPQMGASPLAALASPLMNVATKGAQAGIQAGTSAASSASQAINKSASPAIDSATAPVAGGGGGVAPVGAGGGAAGGAGGGAAVSAPRSIPTATMVQPETASTAAQSAGMRAGAAAGAAGGTGMMGAPYAPMAGQGANGTTNSHSAAAFLHTSDQGGEIVGDLGTATPPVLGETEPNESPDVQLRI